MRTRLAAAALAAMLICVTAIRAQSEAPKPSDLPGLNYDAPFFPGSSHDPAVPTPDSVLGFPVGSKPANHAEIESVFKAVAANNPRATLVEYARSFEGRSLYYLVISSVAKHRKQVRTLRRRSGLMAHAFVPAWPKRVFANSREAAMRTRWSVLIRPKWLSLATRRFM
jgi:hypothetical protein